MPPQPRSGAIAVVEDPIVSNFLRSVLRRKGYQVISVNADQVRELLRAAEPGSAS